MTMRIEGTRPATEPMSTGPAASFAAASPEAVIAEAALQLEESAERAREGERAQRQVRSQARRAEIRERKKAARMELAATCVQAAGQAASAAASGASSAKAAGKLQQPGLNDAQTQAITQRATSVGSYGDLGEAAGGAIAGGLRFAGSKATARAETRGLQADEAADRLEEHRASREQLTRLSERALDHVAQISDAKHQAAMAALRG